MPAKMLANSVASSVVPAPSPGGAAALNEVVTDVLLVWFITMKLGLVGADEADLCKL